MTTSLDPGRTSSIRPASSGPESVRLNLRYEEAVMPRESGCNSALSFFVTIIVVLILAVGARAQNTQVYFLPSITTDAGCLPSAVAVGDLNGDGDLDLAVTNEYQTCSGEWGPGKVSVLLGNRDGTFRAPTSYASGGFQARSVAVGDLNGDGKLDVVVANSCPDDGHGTCPAGSGQIGVLLGNGDGTLQAVVPYYSGGGLPNAVALADLNGDGHPDLVV